MESPRSLRARAMLALLLMVGFYVLLWPLRGRCCGFPMQKSLTWTESTAG